MKAVRAETASTVRLHGEACIDCGNTQGRLYPAGTVLTTFAARTRRWPVVTCHKHRAGSRR